jgi:gamma-glutamyltranspeptidase/glutathione hydrolase
MIVCPQPQAAERGIQILRHGGNAVDAAVATALLQGVVDIQNCGIGGFGQMHVYMSGTGDEKVLDFHGKAGSKVTPEMWKDIVISEARDGFGYVLKGDVNIRGYTSITTPGTVMGLYEAHARYGNLPWKEVVRPAIELAGWGFTVSQEQARNWRTQRDSFATLLVTPEASRIYTKNGAPYDAGEVIANKDYAEMLRMIASEGAEVFYRGEIAAKMVEDFERNGAFITAKDLENYRVKVYTPIVTEYRGYTVASNDAPGGGLTVLELLNILEGYDLTKYDWRGMGSDVAEYIHLLTMAMRAAEADRVKYVGDPEFVDVPTKMIISKARAEEWRNRINSNERILIPKWPHEPESTTHLCVVDGKGNAVSLTHTLGSCSGVITPGLGFFYNNAMINFNPIPGRPNSIAPGKSRITQMSPSMVLKDGRPFIVLGAPGGGKIVSALLHTIVNIVDHGMAPAEAVAHTRFFCLHSDIIDVEARIPQYVCEQLEKKGNLIAKAPASYAAFASVQAIMLDHEKDKVLGGSDPRTGGVVLST